MTKLNMDPKLIEEQKILLDLKKKLDKPIVIIEVSFNSTSMK